MTVKERCSKNGIRPSKYYYRLRVVRNESLALTPVELLDHVSKIHTGSAVIPLGKRLETIRLSPKPRNVITNWILKTSEEWLMLVADKLHEEHLKEKYLHAMEKQKASGTVYVGHM